jgi:hypothetical protein
MKQTLSVFLVLALHSLICSSSILSKVPESKKLRYAYVVETDLATEKFSEIFCDRLSSRHNWNKVSASVSCDETYISQFDFVDDNSYHWKCEVKIKKIQNEINKMSVEMTVSRFLES